MNTFLLIAQSITLALGGVVLIVRMDRRAASYPQPGDATVTAVFPIVGRPSDGQTVIAAAIANSGRSPVVVGLSTRRALLPGSNRTRTAVVHRTTGRRYHASRQAVVDTVPAHTVRQVSVPVSGIWLRHRLVVIIGQSDGRLSATSAVVTLAG